MKTNRLAAGATLAACILLAGCEKTVTPVSAKSESPAKVEGPKVKEGDLAAITLTPEAEKRLGVQVAEVSSGRAGQLQRYLADVVVPPGRSIVVAAPVAGTVRAAAMPAPGEALKLDQPLMSIVPLLPLPRDLRVTAENDVEQARIRVETARLRVTRADKMLKDDVGTVRAQEDARNELSLAASALQAAEARLQRVKSAPLEGDVAVAVRAPQAGMVRQVFVAPGQAVGAGAPLFEVADLKALWLRMPVYAGEAARIPAAAAVSVETLDGKALGTAHPVAAPPTGDANAATVDFYYQAPAAAHVFKPGEKVSVAVAGAASAVGRLQVPFAAIVYDINGGTWVYEQAPNHRYVRRRVQVERTAGGMAILAGGMAPGRPVVIAGAAEMWGVEFGAGK